MQETISNAEVRTYRVGPDFIEKGYARANQKMAPLFLIFLAAIFVPLLMKPSDDLKLLLFTVTFGALLMAFIVFRSIRKTRTCIRKIAHTFELRVSETGLTRVAADTPDASVAFADVTEAIQYPNRGLLLKTSLVLQTLEFPETLQEYRQVVGFVRQRIGVPITVRDERPWNSPVFAMVIGLALWVAFLNITAKTPVLVLGAVLLGLSGWGIWALTKSPNVSKTSKRSRLVYVFLMVITIARMLAVAGVTN